MLRIILLLLCFLQFSFSPQQAKAETSSDVISIGQANKKLDDITLQLNLNKATKAQTDEFLEFLSSLQNNLTSSRQEYISEQETLQKKLEDHQKKDIEARKQLERIQKKMEESNSPLLPHLSQFTTVPVVKDTTSINENSTKPSVKTKYRTEGPKYSGYDKKAKKLISRIYESIKNYLPEGMSEPLIQKIEEDLTR